MVQSRNSLGSRASSVALLAAAGLVSPFWIEQSAAMEAADPFADLTPVSDSELDSMRGGFTTPSGIEFNVGIERVTTVNGHEAVRHSIHNVGSKWSSELTTQSLPDGASVSASADGSQVLIQNGPGNQFALTNNINELQFSGIATLIQNTVDGAVIQHLTTVNVSVLNSAQAIQANNLFGGLNLYSSGLGL